jgi:hypothetical protein
MTRSEFGSSHQVGDPSPSGPGQDPDSAGQISRYVVENKGFELPSAASVRSARVPLSGAEMVAGYFEVVVRGRSTGSPASATM